LAIFSSENALAVRTASAVFPSAFAGIISGCFLTAFAVSRGFSMFQHCWCDAAGDPVVVSKTWLCQQRLLFFWCCLDLVDRAVGSSLLRWAALDSWSVELYAITHEAVFPQGCLCG
jgi:hypothetical protein